MPCFFFCFVSKLPKKKVAIDIPRVSCCHVTSIYHAIPFYFFIKFFLCFSSSSSFRSLSDILNRDQKFVFFFVVCCCCCSCCIIICLLPHPKNTALLLVEETEVPLWCGKFWCFMAHFFHLFELMGVFKGMLDILNFFSQK